MQQAENEIVLVDGYVDVGTLNILSKKTAGVSVSVYTHPDTALSQEDIETFNAQYPVLKIKYSTSFHDRFLILDGMMGYHIGASLKDAGKKSFAVSVLEDKVMIRAVLNKLDS